MSTSNLIVNPSPRTIYLVRHGETEGNLDDKAQGHFDASLTDLGRLQAEALGRRLSDTKFDAVYSSDLRRAFETAKAVIARQSELQIHTSQQLREYHFGDFEDVHWEEVREKDPDLFKRWKNLNTRIDIRFPGGESLREAWQRVGDFLQQTLARHREGNETILVVGHGGSLQALLAHLLNVPASHQWFFTFNNTSVTMLKEHPYTPNTWRTYAFNDTSHLNGIDHIDRSKI